jgi:Cation transporting ATPase, C-terminus
LVVSVKWWLGTVGVCLLGRCPVLPGEILMTLQGFLQITVYLTILLLAVLLLVTAQLGLTYWSPMQAMFGTVSLDLHTWRNIVGMAFGLFVLVELEKLVLRSIMPKVCQIVMTNR